VDGSFLDAEVNEYSKSEEHNILLLVVYLTSLTYFLIEFVRQMPTVKLQSCDGVEEEVDIDVIQCSVTIKTMLEDLGFQEGALEVIPLPNVNSTILKKVIQWATHHKVR
jgi:hypothetical protein